MVSPGFNAPMLTSKRRADRSAVGSGVDGNGKAARSLMPKDFMFSTTSSNGLVLISGNGNGASLWSYTAEEYNR